MYTCNLHKSWSCLRHFDDDLQTTNHVYVGPHTGTVPVLALGQKILPVVELGVFLPVGAPCLNGATSSRTGTPSARTGTETKVQF